MTVLTAAADRSRAARDRKLRRRQCQPARVRTVNGIRAELKQNGPRKHDPPTNSAPPPRGDEHRPPLRLSEIVHCRPVVLTSSTIATRIAQFASQTKAPRMLRARSPRARRLRAFVTCGRLR